MITQDQVEEVRAAADIVGVIGEFVPLKRAGREYKACCPFHKERTPSFCVVPEKGIFKCFGCGKAGDVFGFLMEHAGFSFPDAVRHVARKAGITVREDRRAREAADINRIFYEMNDFARGWFRSRITDREEGKAARAYLDGRGIGEEVAERFGLGVAPAGGQRLREAAARRGFSDDLLVQGGLLGEGTEGDEPYDRFRGRIMFPIEVAGERVVGFGARVFGSGNSNVAKYLNSPETPVFRKGSTLYAMASARNAVRRAKSALLVEGYMDVVSLAAHGWDNSVAPLGTALTDEQAAQIMRYARQVIVLFDSDAAGLRATFRAADTILAAGGRPLVATLPAGEDPDSLVRTSGPDALAEHIANAVDVLDRKLGMLEERGMLDTIDGRRISVDRLLPTLRAVRDPALRDVYFSHVAERTGVRVDTLEAEANSTPAGQPRYRTPTGRVSSEASSVRRPPRREAERLLLLIMLRRPHLVDQVAESVSASDLADGMHRAIFQALIDDPELSVAPTHLSAPAARLFGELSDDTYDLDSLGEEGGRALLADCMRKVRTTTLDRRLREIDQGIAQADEEDEMLRLLHEKKRLAEERRDLAPDDWSAPARKLTEQPRPS